MLGSIVLKLNMLLLVRLYFMFYDFYPVYEFIKESFKAPDKGKVNVTSSIGEKIKKSSEISECFKIMGTQLSFFPYAIRGSMHKVGEFYNQPP